MSLSGQADKALASVAALNLSLSPSLRRSALARSVPFLGSFVLQQYRPVWNRSAGLLNKIMP